MSGIHKKIVHRVSLLNDLGVQLKELLEEYNRWFQPLLEEAKEMSIQDIRALAASLNSQAASADLLNLAYQKEAEEEIHNLLSKEETD